MGPQCAFHCRPRRTIPEDPKAIISAGVFGLTRRCGLWNPSFVICSRRCALCTTDGAYIQRLPIPSGARNGTRRENWSRTCTIIGTPYATPPNGFGGMCGGSRSVTSWDVEPIHRLSLRYCHYENGPA